MGQVPFKGKLPASQWGQKDPTGVGRKKTGLGTEQKRGAGDPNFRRPRLDFNPRPRFPLRVRLAG